jgi:hypothetical protein
MARDLKKDFATIKQQFTRGSGWIGILISFGVITANIKLFENALMPLMPKGFAFQWLYPFAIIGYVIACYLIGCRKSKPNGKRNGNDFTL